MGRTAFESEKKTIMTKLLEKQKDKSILGKRGIFILVGKQGMRECQVTSGKEELGQIGESLVYW